MEKEIPKMETRSLLAMCYILDDYHRFGDAIIASQKKVKNRDFSYDLLKVTQGRKIIGGHEAKRIYNEFKDVIDTINEYGYVSNFIMSNFCWGEKYQEIAEYFYEYLIANRENLETIKAVLSKLIELKFDNIEFDTGLDFSEKKYSLSNNLYHSIHFNYIAEALPIPQYNANSVRYYSETTPYEMEITASLGQITEYGRKIKLNTLVFDPSLLPDKITKETVFDSLVDLKNQTKEEVTAIRNAVDLSIGIEDLQYMIENTMRIIDTIEDETIKLNLLNSATIMLEQIGKMKIERDALESQIQEEHPTITEQKLTLEKKLYKQRRDYESIDLC